MTTSARIETSLHDETLTASVTDNRADVVAAFRPLDPSQRAGLAAHAWELGLRAVLSAHRLAEEARLADIGKSLVEEVDAELEQYVAKQQEAMVQTLQRFFDPRDGQVVTRIEGFLKDGGDLTRALDRFLAPEHGALATTLAKALGENSPLLRRLSPTDSEGVVALVELRVKDALEANRAAVAKALDPVVQDGAVARFLTTLRKDLEKADDNRTKQLALATKALDPADPKSLLSKLVLETKLARNEIVTAMNADTPGSALAILKTSLTTMLEKHAKSQAAVLADFDTRQRKLDSDLREIAARLDERKRGDAQAPRGGRKFEEAVRAFTVHALAGAPLHVEATGDTVGARSACRKGDQVARFHAESIYAGAAVVIEAKREQRYTVAKALEELEIGRSNRSADAGVFVMAKSHAGEGFPTFARYGNDVLVVWDESDEATDPYLQAALFLALGLATRQRRGADQGNLEALADVEQRIEREMKRHEKMRSLSSSIQQKSEELLEEVRKGEKGLKLLLKDAKATLKALDVELASAEEERAEPLLLETGSLDGARAVLAESAAE